MSLYCDGRCAHLSSKHRCKAFGNKKLAYVKKKGFMGYEVHEKCQECLTCKTEYSAKEDAP